MDWRERQTPISITGSVFPKFESNEGKPTERFWYVREEFFEHAQVLINSGSLFSSISARLENNRWICDGKLVSESDIAFLIREMRLFYMKTEYMSIFSFCTYMEKNINSINVRSFFTHMRESWVEDLDREAKLYGDYSGPIKSNKNLIDTMLYSGRFHSQEKYSKRYSELLEHMDDSLILMNAYNAMNCGYQMNQICRAIEELREDNLVILLPDHLRHEWDNNCPYDVIK